MKRLWGFWCCCAGDALLIASLCLPAGIDRSGNGLPGMPGWMAFLAGCYWYPSNAAVLMSPFICHRSVNKVVRVILGTFLLLTFVVTFCVSPWIFNMQQVAIGFYVWLSAFAVSGIGFVGSAVTPPAQNPDAMPET